MTIDAKGLHYRVLNQKIRQALLNYPHLTGQACEKGRGEIVLDNVNGQRYIGCGLKATAKMVVKGVPGNDLAAFMDGLTIIVNGSGQDAIGNTMNSGKVVVHGDAGDVLGYSMRGGRLHIKGDVGYRVGIHMKSYKDLCPVTIVGGKAGDFLGEYMAGGLLVVLGLNRQTNVSIVGNYVGTGMHGGTIYIRGELEKYQLGKEVGMLELDQDDDRKIREYLEEYCRDFSLDLAEIMEEKFVKLIPYSHRPYGKIYAY